MKNIKRETIFAMSPEYGDETIVVAQHHGDESFVLVSVDGEIITKLEWSRHETVDETIAADIAERYHFDGARVRIGDVLSLSEDDKRLICDVVDYYDSIGVPNVHGLLCSFNLPIGGVDALDIGFVENIVDEAFACEARSVPGNAEQLDDACQPLRELRTKIKAASSTSAAIRDRLSGFEPVFRSNSRDL